MLAGSQGTTVPVVGNEPRVPLEANDRGPRRVFMGVVPCLMQTNPATVHSTSEAQEPLDLFTRAPLNQALNDAAAVPAGLAERDAV